ncbi:serine acetyltransferase [Pseudomonas tructae]|uniref:Serine acetyltransferase n=1 Tax=Pseudomonas tructae TaxID=2518644 RepID=A0A411MMD1_9PSED|nr:serine O-acetyltransferase [Pseudomonas tructae]QBF27917.1 serine acetyltransferase [Pseudomonas tructae]
MEQEDLGLRSVLVMDAKRHRELFGHTSSTSSFRLWCGMLSPRFAPVLLYRLAYACQSKGLRIGARFFSMLNTLVFGIEIATQCKIGPGLFFPHTHGTVIGALCIGKNAVIYQGVTLGARDLDFTFSELHRPVVGDNAYIGAGAKILGGVRIGDNVVVGANSVVLKSVEDNAVMAGVPAKIIKLRDL